MTTVREAPEVTAGGRTRGRAALLALVLLSIAGAAHGYELLRVNNDPCRRDDQNLSWPPKVATVNILALPSALSALAGEAETRWNLSLHNFRFQSGNGSPCTRDGVATLAVAATPCGLMGFGDALAITRSFWRQDSGELVDADVTFNANSFIVGDPAAFTEVAMHELGHVLGLDHSDACGRSGAGTLMKAFLTGVRLEAPQADDVAGAEFIYNSGSGNGGTVPDGANSCAIAPPRASGGAGLLAWLLVPAALLLARSRRCGD